MSCGIYKWTSPKGKSYIGQSVNLEKRYYDFFHREIYSNPYKKKGLTKIDRARKKYPDFEQWTYEILEYCNPNELNDKEQYYINLYNTFKNGYNETIGGKGCNGYKVSEEFKQLLSISRMGENNPMYDKTPWNKGKTLSEEHKQKLSIVRKGKINNSLSKQVNQYSLDGIFIKTFQSTNEVQRQLGYAQSAISLCCNGKRKTAYGFIWRYHN